jgi:hypothetical protein
MAKKAALSVRISASTKQALEQTAIKDRRSVASLVDKIMADYLQAARTNRPRKYKTPDDVANANLMDLRLPTGKTLSQSTASELAAVGHAYNQLAKNTAFQERLAGAKLGGLLTGSKPKKRKT